MMLKSNMLILDIDENKVAIKGTMALLEILYYINV